MNGNDIKKLANPSEVSQSPINLCTKLSACKSNNYVAKCFPIDIPMVVVEEWEVAVEFAVAKYVGHRGAIEV